MLNNTLKRLTGEFRIVTLTFVFVLFLAACGGESSEGENGNNDGGDATPPTIPTNPDAQAVSPSRINLTWTASTDNVGVTGYRVYRDGTAIGTSSTLRFTDTGLTKNTPYSYTVSAYDAAGNASVQSISASATTLAFSTNCSGNSFSFAVFSDNYSGQEGGLRRIFNEMHDMDPNIHFLASAGDTPSYQRVRGFIDTRLTANDKTLCGATEFPWFPATGNHDSAEQEYMDWWASNWADGWTTNPAASRLATQLPGVTNFRRGPLQIQTSSGLIDADHGTMYSFDYKNAHFIFIDNYEQGAFNDKAAGVWDENGPTVFDPATSQLDWLQQDLEQNTKHAAFVFGHVALLAPCYNWDPPSDSYDCPGPPPPGWSEHNSNFHTDELTQLLADHNVIGFFHGHDHVPSRMLINRDRSAAFERKYWEVANDPDSPVGTPADWEDLQGPGTVWQVDAGLVYTNIGTYFIVRVTDAGVTFEIYRYPNNTPGSTQLWDTWTIPLTNADIYVDTKIGVASCTSYSVITRSCSTGTATAYNDLNNASGAVNPGNTVLIRQATFNTRFTPQISGNTNAPITFRNFPGESVTISLPTGGMQPGIELTDRHYLVLDGINVNDTMMWAQVLNSSNNIFRNSRFSIARDRGSRGGFRFINSDYNKVLNNSFEDGNDSLLLENSNRNLVEGNSFTTARHTLLNISCGNYNVIRNNTFYNDTQKAGETFDCEGVIESLYDDTPQVRRLDATKHNIWEDNRFTFTRASANRYDYNAIQFSGQQGIVRRNAFYDNQGGALGIQVYADEALYNYQNRIYHNTLYNNRCFGLWGSNDVAPTRYFDNVIKNNIFYNNLDCAGISPADIINQNGTANTLINNTTDDPLFDYSPANYLRLTTGSPMIDSGVFLTNTVGSGTGTTLPVADAGYFYDGYGISDEAGDEIQLDNQTDTATVIAIDYGNNILTLDRSLSWSDGQGVALKYTNSAPDAGAYEYSF